MRDKWKQFICIILILSITGCSTKLGETLHIASYQKNIARISRYELNIPEDFSIIDYKQIALELDMLLFNYEKQGIYQPLIWEDTTNKSIGIPAYVGDGRMQNDGEQEAVTVIAAILSATQLGINKSSQNGVNYVKSLKAFYSEEEHIVLNNPNGNSETTSMWYLIYPAILFTQVSILYPLETEIREMALDCINSWYQAYQVMYNNNRFDYTGFSFKAMQPYNNDIWIEPDCVSGIALLLYYGYEMTGNAEYMEAAMNGFSYLNTYIGSPLYEALLYFAPYIASMFNTMYSTTYSVEKMINDVLNGNSIPRGGWGSITGNWGDYPVNGLMGSTSDGGGYAFSMNTFAAAYAMSPVAKYDTRYAASLGKWLLNLIANSRFFFADQTETANQSAALSEGATAFADETNAVVPYEGIRKSMNSKTPWFGGDPTVYGWAETDFSLYSGAHIGLLAAIYEETNIEGILRIDLNKADLFHQKYKTYLIYNPYEDEKEVDYQIKSDGVIDLFDNVSKEYIVKDVSSNHKLKIKPNDSVVVIELPAGSVIERDGIMYQIGDYILGIDGMSTSVINYENNAKVSGNFQIKIECISTFTEDKVKEIIINVSDKTYRFNQLDQIKFKSKDIGKGSKTFQIKVIMESGLEDQTEIRLIIE